MENYFADYKIACPTLKRSTVFYIFCPESCIKSAICIQNAFHACNATTGGTKTSIIKCSLKSLESIYPMTRPFTFSNICRILNIFALYVQQIVSMFWITSPVFFNSRKKSLFIQREQPFLNN